MADARYITTEISTTMTSSRRNPRSAVIPPFSFVGDFEVGVSGLWFPTSTMQITGLSFSASGPGSATASITVLMEEPATQSPIPIYPRPITLQATDTKVVRTIDRVTVTPYDKLYVASWVDSGHTGVVIQLIGELMT